MIQKHDQLFKELTESNGIAGHEKKIYEIMERELTNHVDSIEKDGLGSLISVKSGVKDGPKIMIAGHLDEVGFVVNRIDEKGFVYFTPVGG